MMSGYRVPLIDAVSEGNIDKVKELILEGAYVDEQTESGDCSVYTAVNRNDDSILKVLIDAGANVDIQDVRGRSMLQRAQESGYLKVAALIGAALKKKNIAFNEEKKAEKEIIIADNTVREAHQKLNIFTVVTSCQPADLIHSIGSQENNAKQFK